MRNDEVCRHLVKGENEKFAINKSFCLRTGAINNAYYILKSFKVLLSEATEWK